MSHLTLPQRLQILDIWYESGRSTCQTYRNLAKIYGQQNRPSERAISDLIKKFRETFSLCDNTKPTRVKTARSEENIAAVNESVKGDPELSIRRRVQEVGLCPSTTWKILRKDLGLRAYKYIRSNWFRNWSRTTIQDDVRSLNGL